MTPRTLVQFDRRPMGALRAEFRWDIPAPYNIGVDVCDKWADERGRVALVDASADPPRSYTFAELRDRSNRWANALASIGVAPGDRVAIILSQRPETAIAHVAVYKLGAIAVPLATLFGDDALEYRLRDSGARAVVIDGQAAPRLSRIKDRLPDLAAVIAADADALALPGALDAAGLEARAADRFEPKATGPDDPAGILYTSGTTGPPKGAVLPHRALIGHLPAFSLFHDLAPQPGDRLWSPADWAWIGGLFNVLLAGWHYGLPVVAYRQTKFDPDRAFWLLERYQIRNAFIFPTALKLMRALGGPRARSGGLALRSVCSAGEPVGEELIAWGRETLGVTINEFYGQTEMNLVTGNCGAVQPVKPGSIGTPYPGHEVDALDAGGAPARAGEIGEIAVRRPDPVMFLGYWNDPEATARKFRGDWALMGDLGARDEDGYLWFLARKDDLIKSGAYRIGPGEVEECLLRHPAVAMAGVIGVPDPERGQTVKAYVCLAPGHEPSPALATALQDFVKARVGFHAYPRLVEFVAELPLTTTGKLQRYVLREQDAAARARAGGPPAQGTQGTAPSRREPTR
jgi:acetyl-CoA synthetase